MVSENNAETRFGWLHQLGNYRDGLLVVATLMYILGYAVWTFNAWNYNLGPLPGLDSQYFIAGIIPIIIFVLVYLMFKGVVQIRGVVKKWLSPIERPIVYVFRIVGFFLIMVSAAFLLRFLIWSEMAVTFYDMLALLPLLFFDLIIEPPASKNDKGNLLNKFIRWIGTFYVFFIPFSLGIIGVLFYVLAVYPAIPQEFGGVYPRCAYIDLEKQKLSETTLHEITPLGSNASQASVVKSQSVYVYFVSKDFLLVKIGVDNDFTYQIMTDTITSITWCGNRSPSSRN